MGQVEAWAKDHFLLWTACTAVVIVILMRFRWLDTIIRVFWRKASYLLAHYPRSSKQVLVVSGGMLLVAFLLIGQSEANSPAHSIGEFLIAATLISPIYDFVVKASLHEEVGRFVLGINNSAVLNIRSFYIPRKAQSAPTSEYKSQVDAAIRDSHRLEIVANHSLGIFSHYSEAFSKRSGAGKSTALVLIERGNRAEKYIDAEVEDYGDKSAKALYANSKENAAAISNIELRFGVTPRYHNRVLRYEFMRSDNVIWVAPYLNTNREARPPWLVVTTGSDLYDFYDNDISAFFASLDANPGVSGNGP